ncbi:MAG: DUF4124 domain-containing protein [Gammaproteobacteria bacterium]
MKIPRFTWLLAAWLIGIGAANAAMYKWVDENGVTQYTQYPPPSRDYQTMVPPPPAAEAPAEAQKKLEETLQRQDEARKARAAAGEEQQKTAEATARREQNCQNARANLERLTTGGNRRILGPDGVAYYPTDEERQERISKAQKQIEENCD